MEITFLARPGQSGVYAWKRWKKGEEMDFATDFSVDDGSILYCIEVDQQDYDTFNRFDKETVVVAVFSNLADAQKLQERIDKKEESEDKNLYYSSIQYLTSGGNSARVSCPWLSWGTSYYGSRVVPVMGV